MEIGFSFAKFSIHEMYLILELFLIHGQSASRCSI